MALFIKSRHEKEAQTSFKKGANQFQREKQNIGLWFDDLDDLDDLVEIQNFHNFGRYSRYDRNN